MHSDRIKELLIQGGFILCDGHFLLKCLKHSGDFANLKKLVENSLIMDEITSLLAEVIKSVDGVKIDLVIGPAYGANTLAMLTGYYLSVNNKQMKKDEEKKQAFRNDFDDVKGKNVLIVEDVITSGGTVKEIIELVKQCGGNVVMVAAIVDRNKLEEDFGVPYVYGTRFDFPVFEADNCPICKEGEKPLVKLGS